MIENISRPELWKSLERKPFRSAKEYCDQLVTQGYRISDWVLNVCQKQDISVGEGEWPLSLVRVSVGSLGFSSATTLEQVYDAALRVGYAHPPVEAALALRFSYDEQPIGEWLRVATKIDAMIDSDGVPHLPKLGHALGNYYMETYWAYPKGVFHPHNEFVFIDPSLADA